MFALIRELNVFTKCISMFIDLSMLENLFKIKQTTKSKLALIIHAHFNHYNKTDTIMFCKVQT